MSKSGRLTIGGAAIILTAANLLGRGLGFFREIVFANEFGLSQDFDIYLVGAIIPLILNTSLFYFAQNFFIPHYNTAKKSGQDASATFFNKSFFSFLGFGLLIALALFIFRGFIIDQYLWNSPADVKNIAENVLSVFICSIPVNFSVAILSSYLFAEFKYSYPAISQLFLNVSIISVVLLFSGSYGIYAIAIGFLTGYMFQLLFLAWAVFAKSKVNLFKFTFKGKVVTGIKSSVLIILFIEVVNQFHLLVDRYFINYLNDGGISTLNYASTLYITPITIISGALSTAIFPALSEKFTFNKTSAIREQFLRATGTLLMIFIPLSVIYIFWGEGFISVIYKRGAFTAGDVILTADVLSIYAYSMAVYAVYSIVNKLIFSAGLYKYLFYVSVFIIGLKIMLNFLLAENFQQNGLALSSSVAYAGVSVIGYLLVNFKLSLTSIKPSLKKFFLLSIVSVSAAIVTEVFFYFIVLPEILSELLKIFLFVSLYTFFCSETELPEYKYLENFIKTLLKR